MSLMARPYNQAQKFGAEIAIPEEVVALERRCEAGFISQLRERRAGSAPAPWWWPAAQNIAA